MGESEQETVRRPIRELMDDRLLDELLARSRDQDGGLRLTGEGSMLGDLVKAVLERALEAELTAHLGYDRHVQGAGAVAGNARNGKIRKTVQTGVGPVQVAVPRDRAGSFEPMLVPKRAGRVSGGLDDMVISLYAHGMTVRDIVHHLDQVYGTRLSPETVSRITEQVMEEVKSWQRRPLDPVYAVVFLDAIVVKVRDNHVVHNKPAYLAVGIDTDGDKHVLGIWVPKAADGPVGEGAGFWRGVVTDLRNRGVTDILIACCDGLGGFEDAITAAFPHATVQTCVVHLIRNALRPVPRKDRAAVAAELKKVYTAVDADAAFDALATLATSELGKRYPQAVKVWETAWEQVTPFLAFTPAVRRLLYTTNSIESLNYQLRKVTKARGHFPTDDAVVKLLWLAIVNIEDKRARERAAKRANGDKHPFQPARLVEGTKTYGWPEALNELAQAYPGRIR
ncbi:transposase-like protein [Actinomadura rupiterrae]|nr:transposase-like protein [Actinomadura rupiterrae]MCP2338371.1 transposase-like protein [Actinomadura rupiterrae]MCP2339407.1 transposase-like protein [Actinomadura rupiterrae]MCP2341913.1 transposase-like protein [Actinomadura rupiterrae]MCP2342800.1 transposase-like protein [Actinomadura rupiterrae]